MHQRRSAHVLRSSLIPAVVAAALAGAAPARAQEGFALAKLQPSFAGDRLFGVLSPYTAGDSTFHAMVLLDYAHDPLTLRGLADAKSFGAIVSDQTLLHVNASYAVGRIFTFNVDLPFAFSRGEQPSGGAFPAFATPTGAAVADLRLGARASLVGAAGDPFQLGVAALVWVPTGSRAAFASDGAVRGQPLLVAGGASRYVVWSLSVGPELRGRVVYASQNQLVAGPSMRWGTGVGFLPGGGSFQIGPELTGGVLLGDARKRTSDAELLLGSKFRFAKSFEAGFGAGLGFGGGVGTPDFRSVLSLAYTPRIEPPPPPADLVDRDGDGIPDMEDACPDTPGVRDPDPAKNGCPAIPDRDGDGIPDGEDACPDAPGVRDPVPTLNGCPPDRDNDHIPDDVDACPDQIGPPNADPKRNGCPSAEAPKPVAPAPVAQPNGDRDGDKIPDEFDACPDEKGPADPDPNRNGCPKDVRVTEAQIVLLAQIEFDQARATIRAVSSGLIDTLAQVLREHPEIVKVEIQGHTDNTGPADANTLISQQRAEAVVAALVHRGIEAGRLVAKGYGPTHPLMANVTPQARQKNRRVEIHIVERRKEAKKP